MVYNVVLFLVYWHPWVPQNYCASISAPKTWAPNPAINGWDWETARRVMKNDVWPWQSHSCNLSGNFHISIMCFNQIFDLLLISLYTKLWPLTWIESMSVICRASMCVGLYKTVNFGRSDYCYVLPFLSPYVAPKLSVLKSPKYRATVILAGMREGMGKYTTK